MNYSFRWRTQPNTKEAGVAAVVGISPYGGPSGAASIGTAGGDTVQVALDKALAPSQKIIDLGYLGISQSSSAAFNRTTIQSAFDFYAGQGYTFQFPGTSSDAYIAIDRALIVPDEIYIRGKGSDLTHIRNTSATEAYSGAGRVFDVGDRNQTDMLQEPTYPIMPVAIGDKSVKLVTASDRANFSVGMVVWARTTELNNNHPVSMNFNEIESIATDGTIVMKRVFAQAIGGSTPLLVTSSGTVFNPSGRARRMVKRAYLSDLAASTTYGPAWVTAAGGSYECVFERMRWMGRAGIFYNNHAYCIFNQLDCDFHDRLIEIADNSHDNWHGNITGRFVERGFAHQSEPLISINANVRRCVVDGFRVFGDASPERSGINIGQANDCVVRNGEIYARNLDGSMIQFQNTLGESKRNIIENVDFYISNGAANRPLINFNQNAASDEEDNKVNAVRFFGTQVADYAVNLGRSKRAKISNVTSPLGGVSITPGAVSPDINNIEATSTRFMKRQTTQTRSVANAVNNGSGLVRLTVTGHGFLTGDRVRVSAVGGITGATGTWTISVIDADNFDLVGTTFGGTYTSGGSAVWLATARIRNLIDQSAIDFVGSSLVAGAPGTSINSTSSTNLAASLATPANTLLAGDRIGVNVAVNVPSTATNGSKFVVIRGGTTGAMTTIGTLAYAAGETGGGRITGGMYVENVDGTKIFDLTMVKGTSVSSVRVSSGGTASTLPYRIEVIMYVANGADSITLDMIELTPIRAGNG